MKARAGTDLPVHVSFPLASAGGFAFGCAPRRHPWQQWRGQVTVEEIQRKVSEYYNIRMSDIIGPKRLRSYARPRQVAMYLCKQLTSRSLPEIGRRFGGRDHTTVMHGVRRIEELKTIDGQIAEDVEMLRRSLEA